MFNTQTVAQTVKTPPFYRRESCSSLLKMVALEIILGASLVGGALYYSHMRGIGTIGLSSIGVGGAVLILGIVLITIARKTRKKEVKGTVYIAEFGSGFIHADQKFQFAKRILTKEGEPLVLGAQDFYVKLAGTYEKGKDALKHLSPNGYLTLPSTLFNSVKEGESVSFYYDGVYFELTCNQKKAPGGENDAPFERQIEVLKFNPRPYLFKEDLHQKQSESLSSNDIVSKKKDSSNSYVRIAPSNTSFMDDLSFYEKDQNENGAYSDIRCDIIRDATSSQPHSIILDVHSTQYSLNDFDIITHQLNESLYEWFIFIPHKIERNVLPDNSVLIWNHPDGTQEILNKENFDPKKHRTVNYLYGKKCSFQICANCPDKKPTVHIDFNENGYLQISFS